MTERAIITFNNPKDDQKITISLTHDTEIGDLDVDIKFDPVPTENQELGLIGYLSQIFLEKLNDEHNITN